MGRILACLSILLTPSLALSSVIDGNELHEMCNAEERMALAYVAGVIDQRRTTQLRIVKMAQNGRDVPTARAYVDVLDDVTQKACMPQNYKMEQARDVVCQYLQTHPATRHNNGAILAVQAMADAWPCPEKSR